MLPREPKGPAVSHSVEVMSLRGAMAIRSAGRNSQTFTTESWIPSEMNRSDVRTILETSLYRPVKAFLEGLGFVVKGEVGGSDLAALKGDDLPLVVICELKLTFNLELILQGVDRATASDEVWLAARLTTSPSPDQ
jgi:hypothetical protein